MGDVQKIAEVILEIAVGKTLDYSIPLELREKVVPGMKVEVLVRGYLRRGYIYKIKEYSSFHQLQPIAKILFEEELIDKDLFDLAAWISRYYYAPLNKVIKMLLPAAIRKDNKAKEQFFIIRKKTKQEIREYILTHRDKHPSQAAVLDVVLSVKKGILLSELMEKSQVSRSPIETLIKNGFLERSVAQIDRSPVLNFEYFRSPPKKLNEEQLQTYEKIAEDLEKKAFRTHLIHGITGSGKTEVYLQLAEKCLSLGRSVIMLVPEISLTAQTIERFQSRFDEPIAILHHRLSDGERFDVWHKIRRGECRIVVGARSAIFSPIKNLGLIIVDEEHESSYKQSDEPPCYNGRDIAILRGSMNQSVVVLGSATPSLETYYNAVKGKYSLHYLGNRAEQSNLPKVAIVDMRLEKERGGHHVFSNPLLDGIRKRQQLGEQTILFLNRRGYHTNLSCASCGETVKCSHCSVSLTFHYSEEHLACHLCGFSISPPPKNCPSCKSNQTMKFRGFGTEQVERTLHAIIPDIRTLRLDADTTRHKGAHEQLFRAFRTGKADVLIGTQMIAKGLHFPSVTLVGVLNSDSSLNIPDFKSGEATFQLITQVSGRSGRGILPGEVIIQTYNPEHDVIQMASQQDYIRFFNQEIESRELFGFPPFNHLNKITFSGKEEARVVLVAKEVREQIAKILTDSYVIHPVVPSGYSKIKDDYRYQLLLKGPSVYQMNEALQRVLIPLSKKSGDVHIHVDVNPSSTFF